MNTVVSTWSIGATDLASVATRGDRVSPLKRFGIAVWRALEAVGRSRGNRELLDFANKCEAQQPALARELRAACRQGPVA